MTVTIWTEVLHNTLKQSVPHKYLKIFWQTLCLYYYYHYFLWGQRFNIQEHEINRLQAIWMASLNYIEDYKKAPV